MARPQLKFTSNLKNIACAQTNYFVVVKGDENLDSNLGA